MIHARDNGRDVTGVTGRHILGVIGLDPDQAADALLAPGPRIIYLVTLGNRTGVNPDENQLADELVGLDHVVRDPGPVLIGPLAGNVGPVATRNDREQS